MSLPAPRHRAFAHVTGGSSVKLRTSVGTALAAATGILALAAAPALASASPVGQATARLSAGTGAAVSVREAGSVAAAGQRSTAVSQPSATIATHLTISSSSGWISAGQSVTLTVHLDRHGTNHNVTIWGQDWSHGAQYVVASGPVDSHNNFTVTYRSYQNHSFWATFGGGAVYQASTSARTYVHVAAVTSESLLKTYGSTISGGRLVYKYHQSQQPLLAVSVKAGAAIAINTQVYYNGQWVSATQTNPLTGTLDSTGKATIAYSGFTAVPYLFRVETSFAGDARNGGSNSGWKYFNITK